MLSREAEKARGRSDRSRLIRKLSAAAASVFGLLVLRRIAKSATHPVHLCLLIFCGVVAVFWRTCPTYFRSRGAMQAAAKPLAGACFLILLTLFPHWWRVLKNEPLLWIIWISPIALHFAVALTETVQTTTDRSSLGLTFAKKLLPEAMAPLVYAETAIIARALFSWRKPRLKLGERAFTSLGIMAPVLIAVLILSLVEILILHVLLARFSLGLANVATGIGALTFVYLLGVLKSLKLFPTIVGQNELVVRLGTLQEVRVARRDILLAEAAPIATTLPASAAKLSGISAPNIIIHLHKAVAIKGHFLRARRAKLLALYIDDRDGFLDAVS